MTENQEPAPITARYTHREPSRNRYVVRFELLGAEATKDRVDAILAHIKRRVECETVEAFPPRQTLSGWTAWIVRVNNPTSPTYNDHEAWFGICLDAGVTLT